MIGEGFKGIKHTLGTLTPTRRSPCFDWRRIQSFLYDPYFFHLIVVAVLVLIGEGFKAEDEVSKVVYTLVAVLVLIGEGFKDLKI